MLAISVKGVGRIADRLAIDVPIHLCFVFAPVLGHSSTLGNTMKTYREKVDPPSLSRMKASTVSRKAELVLNLPSDLENYLPLSEFLTA